MSDDDVRIGLARLDGRLQGVADRLDRQETACERRAEGHVDTGLYVSERDDIRRQLRALDHAMTELKAGLDDERRDRRDADAAQEKKQTDTRRWVLGALVFPVLVAFVAAVLGGVL